MNIISEGMIARPNMSLRSGKEDEFRRKGGREGLGEGRKQGYKQMNRTK